MRKSFVRNRYVVAALATAALSLVLAVGCAAPSGGTVVTQGYYSGQYSITNSPVTYSYDGVAGGSLNVHFVDSLSGETSTPLASLVAPDGVTVPAVELRGSYARRYVLPLTGRYTIRLQYPDVDTYVRRYDLAISQDEDRGLTGLGRLGSALPGQRVTYHYAGTAGERLNRYGVDRVIGPDGQTVVNNGIRSGQVSLPATGDYRVDAVGRTMVLSHDLEPVNVSIGATIVPLLVAGQHIDLLYSGAAGEALGVGLGGGSTSFELRGTNDAPLVGGFRYVLPADGTYRVVVTEMAFTPTSAGTLWMSHDLDLGTLTAGSWPATGRAPGQSVVATYSAVAGQPFRLRTLDPPGVKPSVAVTDPNGLALGGVVDSTSSSDPWATYTPMKSGPHQILVTPRSTYDGGLVTIELAA